jgi:lysophospholipase
MNYSYIKSSFTDEQMGITQDNAFNLARYGNETVDAEWPACLACVVIKKSVQRLRTEMPEVCGRCFRRHCWDGSVNGSDYQPILPGLGGEADVGAGVGV